MESNVGELLMVLSFVSVSIGQTTSPPSLDKTSESDARCMEMAAEPYFEPELVAGQPWRIYYTWNMRLENRCMDMTFKIAPPSTIRRIYYDMNEYLEEQPAWGAASLLLTMGRARREMLLFDDQGPAGRFLAVPNVMRDGSMSPTRSGVPLLKFQMKLLNYGKFLIIMDCYIGVASLAARFEEPPYRSEIESAALSVFNILGEGNHACVQEHNPHEKLPLD